MYIKRKLKLITIIMGFFALVVIIMLSSTGGTTKPQDENVFLPIIMYHSLLKDEKLQNDYVISPSIFENDLKYLTQNGYTTITVSDLEDFVFSEKALPEKCIMLTFDDGYYNNYYYAYPLLKKYNSKIIFSPIVSMTEHYTELDRFSTTYGYADNAVIKEMISSGLVEVQNHTYDMHLLFPRKGIGQKAGESDEEYISLISEDLLKAHNYIQNNFDVTANCFVYPFGEKNDKALTLIKKLGYICTLTCTEQPNYITKNPESLFELGRYRRDGNESIDTLMKRIIKDGNKLK